MTKLGEYTGQTALVAAPTGDKRVTLYRITSRSTTANHLWLSQTEAEHYANEILAVVRQLRESYNATR